MDEVLIILIIYFFVGAEDRMINIKFRCPLDKHWYPCGSCVGTCSNPEPQCPKSCEESLCDCYPEFVRDERGNCIDYDHCFRSSTIRSASGEYLRKMYGCNSKDLSVEVCLRDCDTQGLPKFILFQSCPNKCCPRATKQQERAAIIESKCV